MLIEKEVGREKVEGERGGEGSLITLSPQMRISAF